MHAAPRRTPPLAGKARDRLEKSSAAWPAGAEAGRETRSGDFLLVVSGLQLWVMRSISCSAASSRSGRFILASSVPSKRCGERLTFSRVVSYKTSVYSVSIVNRAAWRLSESFYLRGGEGEDSKCCCDEIGRCELEEEMNCWVDDSCGACLCSRAA